MGWLKATAITQAVKALFMEANFSIGADVTSALKQLQMQEDSLTGQAVIQQILDNHQIAATEKVPICQDTGMGVVFAEVGQDLQIIEGDFEAAVEEGVRQAYQQGYLRKSLVKDPLFNRRNTEDNTPAVIYTRLVPGEHLHLTATAKGFGSENMSRSKILTPAQGLAGFKKFVLETVSLAGSNPCPPIVVGIGVGGTLDKAAQLAKWATVRTIGEANPHPLYGQLEQELLQAINELGIGPAGLGGRSTALAVHVEYFPGHIAGIPVVVNLCCHCARHKEVTL